MSHDYIITVMSDTPQSHKKEFDNMVGDLAGAVHEVHDPVALATMLYTIAEEKKSTNLLIREINAKFDALTRKIAELEAKLSGRQASEPAHPAPNVGLSERDEEVIEFIKEKERVCAEDLQERFNYRGRNAASARLSKLFKDGLVGKVFVGRKVFYEMKP